MQWYFCMGEHDGILQLLRPHVCEAVKSLAEPLEENLGRQAADKPTGGVWNLAQAIMWLPLQTRCDYVLCMRGEGLADSAR